MRLATTKLSFLFFILSLVFTNTSHSQEITCKILDAKSSTPISFATVLIKNKNKGVVADENGFFRLPHHYKNQKDTLLISAIGYKTKQVVLNSLFDSKLNIIKVQPKTEFLNEIVLVSKKGRHTANSSPLQI